MRECGPCTLCCKILPVTEINKPQDHLCEHANNGCMIYETRPHQCRVFNCLWLVGLVPEAFRPDKVHCVVTHSELEDRVTIHVEREHPGAWRDGKFGDWVTELSRETKIAIAIGE